MQAQNPFRSPRAESLTSADDPLLVTWRQLAPRAIRFGIFFGLLWTIMPAALLLSSGWGIPGILMPWLAGLTSGVMTSLILVVPLTKSPLWGVPVLGLLSLALGAFVFGLVVTWLQFGLWSGNGSAFRTGGSIYLFASALQYVAAAWWWPLSIINVPAALGTTFALHAYLQRR